jgi:hypothetical protein
MTNSEQNELRLAAWDEYKATRDRLLSFQRKVADWIKPMGALYDRLFGKSLRARETDLLEFPARDEYAKVVNEMRATHLAYLRLRQEVKDFGFIVEADDALVSGAEE